MTKEERAGVYRKAHLCGYSQGLEKGRKEYKEKLLRYIFQNIRNGKYKDQWELYDDIINI